MANTLSSSALTLSEYATLSNDPLIKKVTYSLHEVGSALVDIPLRTDPTLRMRGSRWIDNLPSVNYTPLNTAPVITKGKPTQWAEQVYVVANQFQVDEFFLLDDNAIENPLDSQVKAWTEHAFKFDFNYKFINNGRGAADDPNAWVGLKYRLNNTAQYGINSEMLINGGLTMTTGMAAADAELIIETVQQVLDYMNAPSGENCVLYCNDIWKRRFERAVRTLGAGAGFDITKDAFDRPVETYKAMKIRDLGRVAPTAGGVQTTRIVSTTENSDGTDTGNSTYTSFYIVRYGEDYLSGWQMAPLKPKNLGLDPTNGAVYNVVVRYAMGLWTQHTRSIARVYNCRLS